MTAPTGYLAGMDVTLQDAMAGLAGLVDEAMAGKEVVITRAGLPMVRLVPVPAPRPGEPRRGGWLPGLETPEDAIGPLRDDEIDLFYR